MRLRSEIVFPRASATGYHCFYVIRQIRGTGRAQDNGSEILVMNDAAQKWRKMTRGECGEVLGRAGAAMVATITGSKIPCTAPAHQQTQTRVLT